MDKNNLSIELIDDSNTDLDELDEDLDIEGIMNDHDYLPGDVAIALCL